MVISKVSIETHNFEKLYIDGNLQIEKPASV